MTDARWTAVDRYLEDTLVGRDEALAGALAASGAAGLPSIAVSPTQGKLLSLLAGAMRARRILELGTLGGYSGIWLARALPPGGVLVTIEADPKHAEVARRNFERAGVSPRIDLRVGPALDVLARLETEAAPPFDFVFIDADKINYPQYLDWAIRLGREGTLIVADNVVRNGAVADAASADDAVRAMRKFLAQAAGDARVSTTVIQTVGVKGYDGVAVLLVRQGRDGRSADTT
jgi:predicted O-methyltransferase YrrM